MRPGIVRAALMVALLMALVGCSSATDSPDPEPTAERDATSPPPNLPVIAANDGYCEVLEKMLAAAEQGRTLSQETNRERVGASLEFMVEALGRLAASAEDGSPSDGWQEAAVAYQEAHSFYQSIGGQIANDDFILHLGEAVVATDAAVADGEAEARSRCDLDISALSTGR